MFRFTIRDVLWLTVVVALGVAVGLDRLSLASARGRLRDLEDGVRILKEENANLFKIAGEAHVELDDLQDAISRKGLVVEWEEDSSGQKYRTPKVR